MLPLLSLKIFASWCILKQAVWRRFTFQSWLPNIKTKFARLEMRGFSADRRRGRKRFKIWFPLRAKQKAPAKTSKWAVSWPSCGEVFISGTFDLPEFSLGKQTEKGRRARSFYYTVARGCSGNWAQASRTRSENHARPNSHFLRASNDPLMSPTLFFTAETS